MIELKNLLENIVWHMIESLDVSKRGELSYARKVEMAAYVLNRMKPLYVTSGRGFVYMLQKYENDPQFQADIWVLLSQALKIVERTKEIESSENALQPGGYYYFFPRMYGRVIDGRTMTPLEEGEVSLFCDGKLVPSYYIKWYNPYHIRPDEGGWYAFAPMPVVAEPKSTREFVFVVRVNTIRKTHEYSFTLSVHAQQWQKGEEVFEESFEIVDMYV
jgi:hypothetical protein